MFARYHRDNQHSPAKESVDVDHDRLTDDRAVRECHRQPTNPAGSRAGVGEYPPPARRGGQQAHIGTERVSRATHRRSALFGHRAGRTQIEGCAGPSKPDRRPVEGRVPRERARVTRWGGVGGRSRRGGCSATRLRARRCDRGVARTGVPRGQRDDVDGSCDGNDDEHATGDGLRSYPPAPHRAPRAVVASGILRRLDARLVSCHLTMIRALVPWHESGCRTFTARSFGEGGQTSSLSSSQVCSACSRSATAARSSASSSATRA